MLQTTFDLSNWTISKPENGQQKECYIAQNGGFKVFIKFDVPVVPLRRLSEIEVAPRVLASGILNHRTFIIQEYIAGTYPDWQWFAHNLPSLARFIKRYHDDEELTALLSGDTKTSYHDHIEVDIADLEAHFQGLDASELHEPAIVAAFHTLKIQAQRIQPVKLVPIHADPNTVNILLTGDTLRMVDWDEIELSDPMRDAGQLLWWYVAKQQWGEFFSAYGLQLDEALLERIYWWAARTSFAIALWHVEHSYDSRSFLLDFVAAIHGESNPHAVFR
ncbi:MAG TPA: phosphotransferase [Ktedonobacteraceae bacterium]|nr:phosphotransferase [Ktedonobacteraceae bacterium]